MDELYYYYNITSKQGNKNYIIIRLLHYSYNIIIYNYIK